MIVNRTLTPIEANALLHGLNERTVKQMTCRGPGYLPGGRDVPVPYQEVREETVYIMKKAPCQGAFFMLVTWLSPKGRWQEKVGIP